MNSINLLARVWNNSHTVFNTMWVAIVMLLVVTTVYGCSNTIDKSSYETGVTDGKMLMYESLLVYSEDKHTIDVTIMIDYKTDLPYTIEQEILSMEDIDLIDVRAAGIKAYVQIQDGKVILLVKSIDLTVDVIDIVGI